MIVLRTQRGRSDNDRQGAPLSGGSSQPRDGPFRPIGGDRTGTALKLLNRWRLSGLRRTVCSDRHRSFVAKGQPSVNAHTAPTMYFQTSTERDFAQRSQQYRFDQEQEDEERNDTTVDAGSGRPGSLPTPAPHRSGRAGSSASGSSTDGFATRARPSEWPSVAGEGIARGGGGTASTASISSATDG